MKHSPALGLYAGALVIAVVMSAAPAEAQFQPRPVSEPATGERYHIEGAAMFWFPAAEISAASESFGIPGTAIDFKDDLGLQDQRIGDLRLILRPSRSSKFRFQFTPISYTQSATVRRRIVFNGQAYNVGLLVNSQLDWKAYRFGYEFDFISRDRGFAGFIVEAKYTDVNILLDATPVAREFAHANAPIPAIGGIGRVYVVPNISVTFEMTGFKLPDNLVQDASAHYIDWDLYGTLNFTNNIGAQVGYRSLDVGYIVEDDIGTFKLKGLYLGVVARY